MKHGREVYASVLAALEATKVGSVERAQLLTAGALAAIAIAMEDAQHEGVPVSLSGALTLDGGDDLTVRIDPE